MAKIRKQDNTEAEIDVSSDGALVKLEGNDEIYEILTDNKYELIGATEQEKKILEDKIHS